jgi:molecular chaperone IbpA|tara:strand:- start:1409 stop:1810 length:402 start_codon:yes stop_codon:yes gene_type:complete
MTVGFDRLFEEMQSHGYRNSVTTSPNQGYPPYNVERVSDNEWKVTIAVAGFGEADIEITVESGNLNIIGKKEATNDANLLYQGIATRQFNRNFQLADYVEVEEATLKDGMLVLNLVREVPEALKPKKIKLISK